MATAALLAFSADVTYATGAHSDNISIQISDGSSILASLYVPIYISEIKGMCCNKLLMSCTMIFYNIY